MDVRPPAWNCRNSTPGFSRANIAVTTGTKAPGVDQCSCIVNEWPTTAIRCFGIAFMRGTSGATSGSFSSSAASTLSSRMPRFFSPQFQFLRKAICHSAAVVPTGDAQDFPSSARPISRNDVVGARQAELAEVDRQAEAGVEREQLLQAVAVALDLEVRLQQARDRAHPRAGGAASSPRASA